ncbi:hypothetical protein OROMI_008644 [Orobanche minor]
MAIDDIIVLIGVKYTKEIVYHYSLFKYIADLARPAYNNPP